MSVHNKQSLTATQKEDQYLNSNELLYTIAFSYVTFADMASMSGHAIAVDYDRYAILKYCFFGSSKRKFVTFKYFMCIKI